VKLLLSLNKQALFKRGSPATTAAAQEELLEKMFLAVLKIFSFLQTFKQNGLAHRLAHEADALCSFPWHLWYRFFAD
jgi:hypothetical protein